MKGLNLLHLNVNRLLSKIDELRYIAKRSNAAVIGTIKSKLDKCILDSEIQIDNYHIIRCDRNRKGGGVACYVRNDLSYIEKDFFPEEIETYSLRSYSQKLSLKLLELFTDLLTKLISYKLWTKILPNLILWKKNYAFSVTSI